MPSRLRSTLTGRPRVQPAPERRRRAERIEAYLQANPVRRLQLGAGKRHIDGWLSTDLRPRGAHSIYLDVTEPFPFEDGSLDFVFGEHVIEHVSWHDGQTMLHECLRVLRPGGVLRLATPDVARLFQLYTGQAGPEGDHYLRWHHRRFTSESPAHPLAVVNHNMRAWGHTFLYDEDVLTSALEGVGFVHVERQEFGRSAHVDLCGVEQHGGTAPDRQRAVRWETMCLEGTKHPAR